MRFDTLGVKVEELLGRASSLFVGQAAFSVSTFLVFGGLAFLLPTELYGKVTYVNAGVLFLLSVLDFGLSISTVAVFTRTGNHGVLSADVCHRWSLFLLCLAGASFIKILGHGHFALMLLFASALNITIGLRPLFQVIGRPQDYVFNSLLLSLCRLISLPVVALTGDGWLGLAVYFFAPLPLALRAYVDLKLGPAPSWRVYIGLIRYSLPVAVSAASFVIIPLLPMFAISSNFGSVTAASFGVVLTVLAPLSLVMVALRAVLMPADIAGVDMPRIARPWLIGLSLPVAIAIITAVGSLSISLLFADYRLAPSLFAIFFPFYAATALIGLFNVRAHRLKATGIEAMVNVWRAMVTIVALLLLGKSPEFIVLICGVVLLFGEVWLGLYLRRRSVCG
jgi:hypothetical protein